MKTANINLDTIAPTGYSFNTLMEKHMKTIELDVTWGKVAQETVDFQSPTEMLKFAMGKKQRFFEFYDMHTPLGASTEYEDFRFNFLDWDEDFEKVGVDDLTGEEDEDFDGLVRIFIRDGADEVQTQLWVEDDKIESVKDAIRQKYLNK